MKKTITVLALIAVLALSLLSFAGCNNNEITVDKCWADNETLTYDVLENGAKIGTLTITLTTDLTDKTLPYGDEVKTYSSANVQITEKLVSDRAEMSTTILANNYTVLAVNKSYTDLTDLEKSYTLQSYHDGKNYVYTYSCGDDYRSDKLKVGSSGYTDNEFLYYYIRCYNIDSVPSSIKVADAKNNKVCTLSASHTGTKTVETPWYTENAVDCNEVYITSEDSPSGSGIYAYYLPEDKDSFGTFSFKSTKYPVKIVENNISYLLTSETAFD